MQRKVSIVRVQGTEVEDVREPLRRSAGLLDSPLEKIGPQSRVVIKPNITAEDVPWERGVVSNPHVVRAVAEMISEYNPKEILIAEAIAVGLDVKRGFSFYRYYTIARETGARLVDLYDEEFIRVPVKDGKLHRSVEVARTVLEADYLVVVPVMKTHVATGISVCMKCLMGVISIEQKKKFHFHGLAQSILELNSVVKPDLFIVDGTVGGQGDGPMANEPAGFGALLAGTDARAVDTIAAKSMGYMPDEVGLLRLAREEMGPLEEEIAVVGEDIDKIAKPFRRAVDTVDRWKDIECVRGNACTTCEGVLQLALARAEKMGILEKLRPLHILVGPDADCTNRGEKTLIMGKCLSHARNDGNFVPGCPPQVFLVTDEFREMAGLERIFGSKDGYEFREEES